MRMRSSHANARCILFTAFWALGDQLNPCESIMWCLTTAARNFYQPVLAKIYRDYAIMEAWLSFHDVTIYSAEHVYTTNTVSEVRVLVVEIE